jgi:hypothetical protein
LDFLGINNQGEKPKIYFTLNMPTMGREKILENQTRNIPFSKSQFVKNEESPNSIHVGEITPDIQFSEYHFAVTYERQVANYTRIRKICQYIYKNDNEIFELLELNEQIPNNFKDWHKHVLQFYFNLLERVDISRLIIFEITKDFIVSCKDEMIKICSCLHGSN